MIVKTKFYCKNSSQVLGGKYIKGKWYDGQYETWNINIIVPNQRHLVNQPTDSIQKTEPKYERRYWVINESGEKQEIHRAYINTIFELNKENLRDIKINEIIDGSN